MRAMGFLDDCRHDRRVYPNAIVVERDFDDVDVVEEIFIHGAPPLLKVCHFEKLLSEDGFRQGGIQALEIVAERSDFAAGGQDAGAGNTAGS